MIPNDSTILEAALESAELGIAVFPCHSIDDGKCTCGKTDCKHPGKHPATMKGFKSATTDPQQIREMFSRGKFNIGAATGSTSGWWVLDLDGPDGIAAFDGWMRQEGGELPPIPSSSTGGGGRHLFWKMNGDEIRNTTKVGGDPIDVRGTGGYVILPPSNHASGGSYAWERPFETGIGTTAPNWLLDRIAGRKSSGGSSQNSQSSQASPFTFKIEAGLADNPGVNEGSRHDTAMRLIGRELAAGKPAAQVERLALAFGGRCSPPMDEKEVVRMVYDFDRNRTAELAAEADAVDEEPLPESKWPVLAPAAFHGILGETVKAIEPHSEADPAAVLVQVLTMFGNAIGRGPYFMVEGTAHHPRLFAVVVGATSQGRKGTGGDRAKSLFQNLDLDWISDRVQNGLVSGEGLIHAVRDPVIKTDKNGQQSIVDEGVSDKRLHVVESEFGGVLRVCKREGNTLSPTMRQAWDGSNLRTMAKNSACKATEPHISIIGHITQAELATTLGEVEVFNGLGNRFLWIAARRSKLLPSGGGDLDLGPFVARLSADFNSAKQIGRMRRDEAAEARWQEIYISLADVNHGGLAGAVTSRAEAQVLRLSMIYALADASASIRVEHLEAALAVWRYSEATALMLFAGSTGNRLDDRLLALIRKSPGISRKGLHQALNNHCPAAELVAALARLRDAGRIRCEHRTGTRGRSSECWWPESLRTFEQSEPREQRPPGTSPTAESTREQSDESEQATRAGGDGSQSSQSSQSSQVARGTEVFRL